MTIGLAASVFASDEDCCTPIKDSQMQEPTMDWICGDLRERYVEASEMCMNAVTKEINELLDISYPHNRISYHIPHHRQKVHDRLR